MDLKIRLGRESDLEAMYQLDVRCFEAVFRFSRAAMHRFARGSNKRTLIAEMEAGKLAGFLILTLHRKDHAGYVTTLDVAPEYRRNGVAAALMHEAEEIAAADPLRWMDLHVWIGNEPACHLYEKLGYCVTGREDDFYGPGLHAMGLRKQLPHTVNAVSCR